MLPGLIVIADILSALAGGAPKRADAHRAAARTFARCRGDHAAVAGMEMIDGMLYVGLRPTTHDAP